MTTKKTKAIYGYQATLKVEVNRYLLCVYFTQSHLSCERLYIEEVFHFKIGIAYLHDTRMRAKWSTFTMYVRTVGIDPYCITRLH